MAKAAKNQVIEQAMDELNQSEQADSQSPTGLFQVEEGQNPVKQDLDDSLIHFRPGKTGSVKEELKNQKPALAGDTGFFEEESPAGGEGSSGDQALKDQPLASADGQKKAQKTPPKTSVDKADKAVKSEDKELSPKMPYKEDQAVSSVFSKSKPLQGAFLYPNKSSAQNIPMRITLQQSENLRVAQERIVELEVEIERLRKENEDLIATGDIFRERLDKMIVQNNNLKKTYSESREEFQEEKRTLMDTLSDQGREIEKINVKNKELEKRLAGNIQQIRVRERELENRLELMKLDNQTLSREKDQYILDLKRNIDKMKMDMESRQNRYDEMSRKLEEYRNQKRRVTRGLQMILHISRGNELSPEDQEQEEPKEGDDE